MKEPTGHGQLFKGGMKFGFYGADALVQSHGECGVAAASRCEFGDFFALRVAQSRQ